MMRVVTFGEVMLRLVPEEFLRIRQAIPGRLEATFGGGELNVAISVAAQGGNSAFLTALPDNVITDALQQEMRKFGVDDSLILRGSLGRFGVYFVETGANQRPSSVTYDRNGSSIALQRTETYDWDKTFADATWFHITGITPAISLHAADASLMAVKEARRRNVPVSCDLNFRKKLWNWNPNLEPEELARQTMKEILPFVDVVIANEEDAEKMLGISAPKSSVESGRLNIDGYQHVAEEIVRSFPQIQKVAITLRESYSASHNNWSALLYDATVKDEETQGEKAKKLYLAPTDQQGRYAAYPIHNIVDRVGAGDSFAGALIFALNTPELSQSETALKYATAASCLKHSIKGDFNYSTRKEIEALMHGSSSGRVDR